MRKRWAFIFATIASIISSMLTSYVEKGNFGEKESEKNGIYIKA